MALPGPKPTLALWQNVRYNKRMVKLLMTWDIQSGKEQEYLDFITSEFSSMLMRQGLVISDAWLSQAGEGPQVTIGALAEDPLELRLFLEGEDWRQLRDKLSAYVTNFRARVTNPQPGGFQI
ncbi:MAG: hypothetical protein KatS3mg057_1118 [Herpetosiphonaceae bacterium]|nr:MAG: hypothetical protein KatS3mg057_1118 [Herpetosiphonaceae bacterium]